MEGEFYKWSHDMGVGRQFRMGGGGGTCILDWANVLSREPDRHFDVYAVQIDGLARDTSQRPGTCLIYAHAPIVLH